MAKIGAILDGEFLLWDEYVARKAERYRSQSELACPMLIGDSIELRSMADGKMYTSKAKLRENYRAHGVVEVGNDRMPERKAFQPTGIRDDIRSAMAKHK